MDYTAFIEIVACMSAASLHFALGSVLSFSAVAIPQLEAPDSDIKVTKEDISWIASVVALVMPLGSLIAGYLVDRIGRLHTIRIGTVPYIVGWVCIALAQDFKTMIIGRLLTGFSVAMVGNPTIIYITEVSRAEFRGALICMAPSLTSLGMVVVYSKGAFLHWRTISWLCISYCLLPLLLISLWSPESPVWLVSKGRVQDALKSLAYLFRKHKQAGWAEQRLAELQKEHDNDMRRSGSQGSAIGKLLKGLVKPNGFKPLILLTAIFTFQQLSGIYITIFYTVTFFKSMGANVDPYISTVGVGVVRLVMGLITSALLRNFGRRPLFMFSGFGMAIFIFISGYFTKEIAEENMEKNWVPVICILLYMVVGVMGLMSIPWTMTAEMFPTEIRGMAQGLMVAIASVIMFAVLKVYPFLDDMLGGTYAVLWMFAGVCVFSVFFVFMFLPETHKKELTEIQEYFMNNTIYILSKKKPTALSREAEEEMVKLKDTVVHTVY